MKKTLTLAAAIVFVLTFSGCSNKTENSQDATESKIDSIGRVAPTSDGMPSNDGVPSNAGSPPDSAAMSTDSISHH